MKSNIAWDLTPCSLIKMYIWLEEITYILFSVSKKMSRNQVECSSIAQLSLLP
jgi:hypothetical protein